MKTLILGFDSFDPKVFEDLAGQNEDVMSREVITIGPATPVPDIALLMDRKKAHSLPVVDQGKMMGIVGKIDLIRALARQAPG